MTNPTQNFMEKIKEAAERRQREMSANPPQEEAVATLLKPTKQEIEKNWIQWTWEISGIKAVSQLLIADESYEIALNISKIPGGQDTLKLDKDAAKELGELLLSIHQWQFVWKQHVGDFLLESMRNGDG